MISWLGGTQWLKLGDIRNNVINAVYQRRMVSYLSLQEEEGVDYAVNVIPSAVSV